MNRKNDLTRGGEFDLEEFVRDRTPARLLVGRRGAAYNTATQLELRRDHAAARDAVTRELDLHRDLGPAFIERWKPFDVSTRARTKQEYLLQPHLGRDFDEATRRQIASRAFAGPDLQILIGDGLSASAVAAQVPELLPLLISGAQHEGWNLGQLLIIHHCRVGIMNVVGELLHPRVVVLLIGERPGMSVSNSLSAYMAYEPARGHTDADRNLICNIHALGVPIRAAADRILRLAGELMRLRRSGTSVKEPSPRNVLGAAQSLSEGETLP